MPEAHVTASENDDSRSGDLVNEAQPSTLASLPATPDPETSTICTQWLQHRELHPYRHPLLPEAQAKLEPTNEVAAFLRYIDYVWTQHAEPIFREHLQKNQDIAQATALTLQQLLFKHPGDRISEFLAWHGADVRNAERARTVLYRQFYTWAHENGHCSFNPQKYAQATAFLAMSAGTAPENRILNRFYEFLASPKDSVLSEGPGLDRKIAQQIARPAMNLADFLWKRELADMAGEKVDPASLSELQQAERVERALISISPELLNAFLKEVEEGHGTGARDRSSSAIKKHFLPFVERYFGGAGREAFDARPSPFPELQIPASDIHLRYRAHLLEISGLPLEDPRHLSQGTTFNRDAVVRHYAEFVWTKYGPEQEGSPAEVLDSLLRYSPHDRLQEFLTHFSAGDPKTDDKARMRLEKATSGLRLFYQWAKEAGLSSYDFDSPFGTDSWFRVPLPSGVPGVAAFDGFCDFLGAEVLLRKSTESAGIDAGTAMNYRRQVAKFVAWAWATYRTNEESTGVPEAALGTRFNEEFSAQAPTHVDAFLTHLQSQGISEDYFRGIRSAVKGIFLPWLAGQRIHVGRGTRSPKLSTGNGSKGPRRASGPKDSPAASPGIFPLPLPPRKGPPQSGNGAPFPTRAPQPAKPIEPPAPELSRPERRVAIADPRTTTLILRTRNMAIDTMIGRGRPEGPVTFRELCQLKMHEYDEGKGLLVVYRERGGRTAIILDQDCKAMVNEYVRQVRNARPFLKAALLAGSDSPLFLSADGGSLAVDNAADAIEPPINLKPVFSVRDALVTSLVRQTELPFEELIELPPPIRYHEQSGGVFFNRERNSQRVISVSAELLRRIKEYISLVRTTKIAVRWESPGIRNYFLVGNDGGKLTGDA